MKKKNLPIGTLWIRISNGKKEVYERQPEMWKFIGYGQINFQDAYPKIRIRKPHKKDVLDKCKKSEKRTKSSK